MLRSGLLNAGSFIFGLTAWIVPVICLWRYHKVSYKRCLASTVVSMGACASSLCLQIFEIQHRVSLQDWSALMDTSHAVSLAAALLLAVTIILNAAALVRYSGGGTKD